MKFVPERLGLPPDQQTKRLELWRQMQEELAALSSVHRHYEDTNSDHYVQNGDPDQVVAAVRWTVDQVRQPPEK